MYYIVDENNEIIDKSKNSLKLRIICNEMNQRFGGKCKVINEVEIEKPHKENEMKKEFLVPFQAEETAWNNCIAKVEANSKEEAFKKVKKSIEESNPFADFNASWNGINTVTSDVIETLQYCIGTEYNCTVDDVKVIDSSYSLESKTLNVKIGKLSSFNEDDRGTLQSYADLVSQSDFDYKMILYPHTIFQIFNDWNEEKEESEISEHLAEYCKDIYDFTIPQYIFE